MAGRICDVAEDLCRLQPGKGYQEDPDSTKFKLAQTLGYTDEQLSLLEYFQMKDFR